MEASHLKSARIWWAEGHRLLRDSWVRHDDYSLNWLGDLSNAYHHHTRWVRPSWWLFIWRAPERWTYTRPMTQYRDWKDLNRWQVRWCRLRGHAGIIYYSSGMEPDTRCKRCLEEIA